MTLSTFSPELVVLAQQGIGQHPEKAPSTVSPVVSQTAAVINNRLMEMTGREHSIPLPNQTVNRQTIPSPLPFA